MMHHHYYQPPPFTPTHLDCYSPPSSPTSSIASMPSSPTCSERCGDIHSGSLTRGLWSETEHEQFLEAMKMFPKGPWRAIAAFVGTRSIKQVQTHAQKYQQKIKRRQRGLRKQKKKLVRPEHRVDALASGCIIRSKSSSSVPSQASFLPPRSRKSYTRILADAAMKLEPLCLLDSVNQTFHVDVLLTGLEPFPFTDVTCEELFKQDGRYQQDLQEFANVCPTTTTTSPRDYCSYYLDATMAF